MSTRGPHFLPFPEPMAEELRRLEQAKMHIIAGFLYATGLKGKSIRVAMDLSGLEVGDVPPTRTVSDDLREFQLPVNGEQQCDPS